MALAGSKSVRRVIARMKHLRELDNKMGDKGVSAVSLNRYTDDLSTKTNRATQRSTRGTSATNVNNTALQTLSGFLLNRGRSTSFLPSFLPSSFPRRVILPPPLHNLHSCAASYGQTD
ncbi:hypothetical protein Mapa_007720 [Marchantia paleacea]|nr:hypothetical protein Mapa_007720 [Marchantia paleacea]